MILNRTGAAFIYDDVTYRIGDSVVANAESVYHGLIGTITEIRDGADKETENDTPDIYCAFQPPVTPYEISELEERFTSLYRHPKVLEDIALDMVIMAPEMLRILEPVRPTQKLKLYAICEKWAWKGNCGVNTEYSLDYDVARRRFAELIRNEQDSGCISEMAQRPGFDVESTATFYECFLQDEYCESHYQVSIETKELEIGADVLSILGKAYVEQRFREQFFEQIQDWEELSCLTDTQIAALVSREEVPKRIRKHLEEHGILIEAYWEALSEAASRLVHAYLKEIASASLEA